MTMIYKIKPLLGIGDAKFGMSVSEIGAILGPPNSTGKNGEGETEERRRNLTVRYDDSGVVEFTFLPEADLFLGNVNLFKCSDPISVLMGYDSSPKELVGFVVFFKIGVVITGYHDDDEDQRAVSTFTGDRWDSKDKDYKEFSWPMTK